MSNRNTATPEPNQEGDEEQQEQFSILNAFLTTVHHFFGDFETLFQSVDDPRRPELIIYPLEALAFAGVLMYLCHLGARRQIAHMFRKNGPSAAKFQALFDTATCPHGDTLDVAFARLNPDQVQAVVTGMVRTLMRKKQYDWKYMIVHKEGDIPFIHQEFEALLPLTPENHLTFLTGPQSKTRQEYRWINDIAYTDSEKKKHTLGVLECVESKPDAKGQSRTTRFRWITNFRLKDKPVIELANEGGRIHWKIENEGFNVQKNGGYELEHAYTTDPTASKVFYFLLQMAHLLTQLIEKGSLFRRAFPTGVGSTKNIALRLLEAWRNLRLSANQIQKMRDARLQIRFAPP